MPQNASHTADASGPFKLPEGNYFLFEVTERPFGMGMYAPPDGPPTVMDIEPGRPAEALGIQVGDILLEIAGRPVDSSSWFRAFQQAIPPFGLRLLRPRA